MSIFLWLVLGYAVRLAIRLITYILNLGKLHDLISKLFLIKVRRVY